MEEKKEDLIKKNQSITKTFRHAWDGLFFAVKTQRNFKVHLAIALLLFVIASWLDASVEQFLLLFLAVVVGLTFEMANTAFEKTVDLVTDKYDPKAKIAKDVSAGMMLLVSIGLATFGFLVLLPSLLRIFLK